MKKIKEFVVKTFDTVVNYSLSKMEGAISRVNQLLQVEPFYNTDTADLNPGIVTVKDVTVVGGRKLPSASTDVGQAVVVSEIRQGSVTGAAPISTKGVGSAMRVGFITMKCVNGTPADGGQVFYRYALGNTGSATRAVGTIEAAGVANEVIELPGATFNGMMDADKLVEVRMVQ